MAHLKSASQHSKEKEFEMVWASLSFIRPRKYNSPGNWEWSKQGK